MAAYQISARKDSQALAQFLQKEGQLLLPMVGLIEQARLAVDELIDVTGRAALEAVLHLSAQGVAGAKHPGKAGGDIRWHGRQRGVVPLSNRKLRVTKPRLRRKAGGEVEVPAYAALQERSELGARMLEILMHGVSTRHYEKVLPAMAETVGVKKSSVSREWIEASAQTLKELSERRFDDVDILIIYLDGLIFGDHHVLAAIGVDTAAAASLREGLAEMFTVNRLGLPPSLQRGLCSTNVIESSFAGARGRTRRVTRWQSGDMALRWAAAARVTTEKQFRRASGYEHLWMLQAFLDEPAESSVANNKKIA